MANTVVSGSEILDKIPSFLWKRSIDELYYLLSKEGVSESDIDEVKIHTEFSTRYLTNVIRISVRAKRKIHAIAFMYEEP